MNVMDSRDSLPQDCRVSGMSSLGSSSQIPSSLSLAQSITHHNQEKNLANPTYMNSNLNNNNNNPLNPSSGVAVAVAPSIFPQAPAPAPMTSEHSPTHTPCHNCRTLGQSDCNAVQRDTACNRCLLMGMKCDLDSDLDARGRGELNWSEYCGYCGMTVRKCEGNEGTCGECFYCCEGNCLRAVGSREKGSSRSVCGDEDEASSVAFGEDDAASDSSTKSMGARCQGCGEKLSTVEDVNCLRCRDVMVKTMRGFPGFVPSNHSIQDGQVLNTCAGCFEPKLDPHAAEIYCNGCKESLLRSVALEKNPRSHERNLGRSAEPIEESKSSTFHHGSETSFPSRTGAHPYELLQSQIFNPTSPGSTSQTTQPGETDNSDRCGEPCPDPSWKPQTPARWAFQPCISCQTNSLLCDHALPSCTQCQNTDVKCSYRYLTNPRRTKPVRFDEVPRTCFACFEPNVQIQISGRCGPCDAKARLKAKWKGADASTATATGASASASNLTTASSSSQIEESKSELPRFLASLETRLEDIRLGHYSQQPPHQPQLAPKVEGGAVGEPHPQTKGHIQVPPVLPSETTSTPLPGFTTPCLGCLDNLIPCSTHPRLTSNPPPSTFIKPYKPLSMGLRHLTPTPSQSHTSPLASAIPCLACFDETVCAYHLKSGWDEKVATTCGSCRFAGLECDEAKPGCGACGERGVDCLYIKGSVEGESEGESDATAQAPAQATTPEPEPETLPIPPLTSSSSVSETQPPPPPRACGSCRLSEIPCDETRPGCLVCKEKGLECLYISGSTVSTEEPHIVTTVQATARGEEEDENADDTKRLKHNTLNNSAILHPVTEELDEHSITYVRESQLDDSVILAAASEEICKENEDEEATVTVDEAGAAEVQREELESASESEDWDVVSSNEEYEIVDAERESDDEGSLVL
ncbi:hypothetical protein DL98DRAFT_517224 [Cadophora sp. DSE1049]|nr:hypothetical protein DL98DRAFT_517224 [Cadophora sp. DSE1049]